MSSQLSFIISCPIICKTFKYINHSDNSLSLIGQFKYDPWPDPIQDIIKVLVHMTSNKRYNKHQIKIRLI
jgi:hypothetical protein